MFSPIDLNPNCPSKLFAFVSEKPNLYKQPQFSPKILYLQICFQEISLSSLFFPSLPSFSSLFLFFLSLSLPLNYFFHQDSLEIAFIIYDLVDISKKDKKQDIFKHYLLMKAVHEKIRNMIRAHLEGIEESLHKTESLHLVWSNVQNVTEWVPHLS